MIIRLEIIPNGTWLSLIDNVGTIYATGKSVGSMIHEAASLAKIRGYEMIAIGHSSYEVARFAQ